MRAGPLNRLYVKPEPFDGSSDWEEYFSHFINCAELGRWTNQDNMLGFSLVSSGTTP
jgi:hypothetical protein